MHRHLALGVVAAAAATIISCASSPFGRSGASYFPLATGNTWKYAIKGEVTRKHGRLDQFTFVHRITGKDEDGWILENGITSDTIEQYAPSHMARAGRSCIRADADGLKGVKEAYGNLWVSLSSRPTIYLRFPVTPGDSWEQAETLADGTRRTYGGRVLGEEVMTVPAGTFRAVKVETLGYGDGGQRVKVIKWYAPGVGLVKAIYKEVLFEKHETVQMELDLKEYRLNEE